MYSYYINLNKDINGFNEVHKSSCYYYLIANNTKYLGQFNNAIEAVTYAKKIGYYNADGCYYCSKEAHHN